MTDDKIDPIIVALRVQRHGLRLTQVELARRLGVAQSVLSSYETGARPVTLGFLRAWAGALDLTIELVPTMPVAVLV